MIQEKSVRPELFAALAALPIQPPLCLVTDDVAPDAIAERGHLDHVARCAVRAGMPPLEALRAMTWTPAQRLRLYDRGIVSPGKRADLVLLARPRQLRAERRHLRRARGRPRRRDAAAQSPRTARCRSGTRSSIGRLTADDFRWRLEPASTAPAGEVTPAAPSGPTRSTRRPAGRRAPAGPDGEVEWEGRATLLTIVERHGLAQTRACAPLLGFELGAGPSPPPTRTTATT